MNFKIIINKKKIQSVLQYKYSNIFPVKKIPIFFFLFANKYINI